MLAKTSVTGTESYLGRAICFPNAGPISQLAAAAAKLPYRGRAIAARGCPRGFEAPARGIWQLLPIAVAILL